MLTPADLIAQYFILRSPIATCKQMEAGDKNYEIAKQFSSIQPAYKLRISRYSIYLRLIRTPVALALFPLLFFMACSSSFVAAPENASEISMATSPAVIEASPLNIYRSDWDNMKLQGQVKSMHEMMYGAALKNGAIVKVDAFILSGLDLNRIFEFNETGKITEVKYYLPGSKPRKFFAIVTRYYNTNGNVSEEKEIRPSLKSKYETRYLYDSSGGISYILHSQAGTSKRSRIDDLSYREDFTYDSLKRELTVTTSTSKATHQYDKDLKRIGRRRYNSAQSDSVCSEIRFRYDERGNVLEEADISRNGEAWRKIIFEYDDQDNLIASIGYREGDVLVGKQTYNYTFDSHKNWTRKVFYVDDQPYQVIERVLEYY